MNESIIYEQPVSENIRNILKCEYLYEKYKASLAQENIWGIKSCVATLLETSDFLIRINIKIELLKELEKNIIYTKKLIDNDKISLEKYDNYHSKLKHSIQILNDIKSNPSKSVIDNDFLMQIKSKIYIPAGDNFFDMPSYLNFLTSNKSYILKNIENWYSPLIPLFISSKLILDIRRLSEFNTFTSNKSFFQTKIDQNIKVDLVRIKLLSNLNIYPDVSVNRQNLNIIFKETYGVNRLSKAIDENINFDLSLSSIS